MRSLINTINIRISGLLFVLVLSLLVISCDESEPFEYVQSRAFSPVNFKVNTIGNTAYFGWAPLKGADYLLEVSRDSLLFQTDVQTFNLSTIDELKVESLMYSTMYSARIKSVSLDPAIEDSKYVNLVFYTGSN